MDEKTSNRERLKAFILLLIGFIVGFATHAFTTSEDTSSVETVQTPKDGEMVGSEDKGATEENTATSETPPKPVDAMVNNATSDAYSVSVADQSAGNVVHVSQVTFAQDAWVAIREDMNGELGNILGARRYPQGSHTGSVSLLRGTEADRVYYAVVYVDDGDKAFDFKKDTPVAMENGEVMTVKFRAF